MLLALKLLQTGAVADNNPKANRRLRCLCAVALWLHMNAGAAVATSDDLEEPAGAGETTVESRSRISPIAPTATVGVPQNKTIELLLQLQDQPPSTLEGGRERQAAKPGIASATTPAANGAQQPAIEPTPLSQLREAILGRLTRSADKSADERIEPRADGDGSTERERSVSNVGVLPGQNAKGSGETLLSHPVIRFIRENRALVTGGGVALLTALWLTANLSLRSRRQ